VEVPQGWPGDLSPSTDHLVPLRMMIAVALQVLQSPGDSLTRNDNSLWHFLTIHF